MRKGGGLLVFVLAAGAPAIGVAAAQQPPAAHPVAGHVAAGYAEPLGDAADFFDGGWQASAGVSFRPSSAVPVALRLDAGYARFDAIDQVLEPTPTLATAHVEDGRMAVAHLMLDGLFEFGGGGRVGGWLGAGVGAVNRDIELTGTATGVAECDDIFPICVAPGSQRLEADDRLTKVAFDATAAIRFPLRSGSEIYVEARYLRMESDPATEHLPIVVGFRW